MGKDVLFEKGHNGFGCGTTDGLCDTEAGGIVHGKEDILLTEGGQGQGAGKIEVPHFSRAFDRDGFEETSQGSMRDFAVLA